MRSFIALACLSFLALTGCVTAPTLTPDHTTLESLRGKTLEVALHPTIDAKVQKLSTTLMIGTFGENYYRNEGQRLIKEDGITDPSRATSQAIAENLTSQGGMVQVGTGTKAYTGEDSIVGSKLDAKDLLAFYTEGDYLLDDDSVMWWVVYNIGGDYRVIYQTYTRLINRKTQEPVAARLCVYNSDDGETNPPSYDDMVANHSERLKGYLRAASAKCSKEFIDLLSGKSS